MKKNYKYIFDVYNRKMFWVEIIRNTLVGYLSTEFDRFETKDDNGHIETYYRQDLLTKKAAQKLLMKYLKYDIKDYEREIKQAKDNLKITKDKTKQLEKEMRAK